MLNKPIKFIVLFVQRTSSLIREVRNTNVQVFLTCFVCATFLWFFNALNRVRTEIIDYPIEIVYDAKKYVALEQLPNTIRLQVNGTGWQILWKIIALKTEPIKIYTSSLLNTNKSYLVVNNYRDEINAQTKGVILEGIISDTLSLKLDKRIKRRYFVKVNPFDIDLKTNYKLIGGIDIFPKQITLEGPESYLEKIANPYPLIIPDRSIAQDFEKSIALDLPVQKPELIQASTNKINVKFKVDEYLHNTTNLVIKLVHFPENSKFTLHNNHRRVPVRYAFRKQDIGKIRLADFSIVADFKTFNIQDSTVNLFLKKKPDFISKEDIDFKPIVKLDYDK